MHILSLQAIEKSYKGVLDFQISDVNLQVEQGKMVALVGESGCGKTTILRMIAGLETPDKGTIFINDEKVFENRSLVKPNQRKVGMVFQDNALFPHLTVEKNIAFGIDKLPKKTQQERISKYLKLVGLEDYGKRYPHELSGGQQQRVAIARSLAPEPSILLMDEPFSSLDGILKNRIRSEIKQILKEANITALFVTHDTQDALAVGDQMIVVRNGKILQDASPKHIFKHPVNEYVANMFGKTNLIKGTISSNFIDSEIGQIPFSKIGTATTFSLRPEIFSIDLTKKSTLKGIVKDIYYLGNLQEIDVLMNEKLITISINSDILIEKGQEVYLMVNEEKIILI